MSASNPAPLARLVIAEDEPEIRQNLTRLLRIEGYEVHPAPDGAQALDLVREVNPDLVLSDVTMPVLDGHGLLQALRSDPAWAHLPVIFLTARADRADVRGGMQLGADDYLTKPFQRQEVLDALRTRLARLQAQREQVLRLKAQSKRWRFEDPVTQLPNREHLAVSWHDVLAGPDAAGLCLWVLGLNDLPRLAPVVGGGGVDRILHGVAQKLQARVRGAGHSLPLRAARLAPDALVVWAPCPGNAPPPWAAEWESALLAWANEPVLEGGTAHHLSFSLVRVHRPAGPGGDAADWLARADAALARARQLHLAPWSDGAQAQDVELASEWQLHNDLHTALARGELQAHFQPQVHAVTGELIGFEALMRWAHPELGWVSPARFIPLAEENGCIVSIGQWILEQACHHAVQWSAQATRPLRVAVNLSSRQFALPSLVDDVQRALKDAGLQPAQLELEITEGTAMQNIGHTLTALDRLKALGVQIALDDFGTGYSSLAYLKRFPLDVLKVDQSFVRQIDRDADDRAIATAVIQLARALGLHTIAEGVETEAHADVLRGLGCDLLQGWLLGRPMPAESVAAYVASR